MGVFGFLVEGPALTAHELVAGCPVWNRLLDQNKQDGVYIPLASLNWSSFLVTSSI